MQSRGTTVIRKSVGCRGCNLELFPQSPSLTLETYRAIGRNAARYAKGLAVQPVPVQVDNWARLRLIVKTTLLHRRRPSRCASCRRWSGASTGSRTFRQVMSFEL